MESNTNNTNQAKNTTDSKGEKGEHDKFKKKKWEMNPKTHFINIPIDDPDFIKEYCLWCEDLKSQGLSDFYPELLQKHGKLHMTICVLELGEGPDKIDFVHQVLQSIQPELKKIADGDVNFNFDGYDTMGTHQRAFVVYAKSRNDSNFVKLTEMIHVIIKALVDNGLIQKKQFKEFHIEYVDGKYSIKLHMTLLNCLFLNKVLKKRREKQVYNINAEMILEYLKTRELPSAKIDKIHFSRMREDKKTEKYELEYSYDIY
jgi:hypothetical protein